MGLGVQARAMSFHTKYELEQLVSDGPTKTFRARQVSSGAEVFLHLLDKGGEDSDPSAVIGKVRDLQSLLEGTVEEGVILEVGDDQDSPYVATRLLESFGDLEIWLDSQWIEARNNRREQWVEKIESCLSSADSEQALTTIDQALEDFPDDEDFPRVRETVRLWNGGLKLCRDDRAGEGIEQLREAHQHGEDIPALRAALVDALLRRVGDLVEAEPEAADELLKQVLKLDAGSDRARDLLRQVHPKREEFIDWCLTQAGRLREQNDLNGARTVLDQGLLQYPAEDRLRQCLSDVEQAAREAEERTLAGESVASTHASAPARTKSARLAVLGSRIARLAPMLARLLLRLREAGPAVFILAGIGCMVALFGLGWLLRTPANRSDTPPAAVTVAVLLESSPPGAVLSVNGETCGASTCSLELEPGVYEAEAVLAGYGPSRRLFEVGAGEAAGKPVTLGLLPIPPTMLVSSDLSDGRITLDGEQIGDLSGGDIADGELEIPFDGAGYEEHTLTISARGAEARLTFGVTPGQRPVFQEPFETRNLQAIVVTSLGTEVKVHSSGKVTKASLDGAPVPEEQLGNLEWKNLSAGSHDLQLTAAGKTHQIVLETSSAPRIIAFLRSDRNVGGVRIQTGEDGVSIFLNGEKYRRLTRNGRALLYLYPKKYRVRVEKEGFESPVEQVVEVRKGARARLDFKLTPLPATATLSIRGALPGANVSIDGRKVGQIETNGRLTLSGIEPGRRVITIQKASYQPLRLERDFAPSATIEVAGTMETALGTLRVEVTPENVPARLSLRKEGEQTERALDDTVLQLESGTYSVKASAPGYYDFTATVRVQAGEVKIARLTLRRAGPGRSRAEPTAGLAEVEKAGGWLREGKVLLRAGGGVLLVPVPPVAGTYEFSAMPRRGRRIEWVVDYVDKDNYILLQLGRDFFQRTHVEAGKKSKPAKIPHALGWNEYVSVQIEVTAHRLIHRLRQDGPWTEIDRRAEAGNDFTNGHMGFNIPRRDRIALRSFSFRPW